mmetsp:Transcript_64863/g.159651  ORF Transcript_64863/g.159651 Transcript_64863/m.159651 type:complete len:236 (+) Transcript_64863:196-903(+)
MGDDSAAVEYLSRIFQVRKTLWALLADRGYEVKDNNRNERIADFKAKCTDDGTVSDPLKLTMRVHKPRHERRRAVVLFSGKKDKFATDDVKSFFLQIDEEWRSNDMREKSDSLTAIFVIHKSMTSFAKKVMVAEHQKRNQPGEGGARMVLSFNVFFEAELVVNITDHVSVPKHRLLPPKEKRQLLEKYHVTEDQLPRILITDPVAKYFGLRRGEIVEILRSSATAGRYVTYRICL